MFENERKYTAGNRKWLLALPWALVGIGSAHAQAVADGPTQIETVTVTASKTAESLQKTPLAVTAITGASLAQAGVVDVHGLSALAPNFNIAVNGTTGALDLSIRGITTENDDAFGNPAIAVSVDGVYVARTQGLDQALYDLDRVEVLRGPQGTLYGRNATGGAVNIITNKPSLDGFTADADISYGNYNTVASHAVVNIPLSDTLAIRVSGAYDRDDGLVRTTYATGAFDSPTGPSGPKNGNYDRADKYGGRVSLLWEPTSHLSVQLSVDDLNDTGTPTLPIGQPLRSQTFQYLEFLPPTFAPTLTPVPSANQTDPWKRLVNEGGSNDQRVWNVRGRVDYTFNDEWSLAYVGGYGQLISKLSMDNDGTNVNVDNFGQNEHENSMSHELDLTYASPNLTWVTGANYFRERNNGDIAVDFFGPLVYPNGVPQFPYQLQFDHPSNDQWSYGIFSQATYSLTAALRFTGGLRYSHDEHSFGPGQGTYFCPLQNPMFNLSACNPLWTPANGFPPNFGPNPGQYSVPDARKDAWSNLSWKAGLDYDLSDNSMVYASVSTGYKAGGLGEAPNVSNYRPEKVLSYEIGDKSRFFDDTVTLNTSAFYMKYSDYQVSQNVVEAYFPTGIPGFPAASTNFATTNAGSADIYGLETEAAWLITPDDRFDGYASYLHATFQSFKGYEDLIGQPGNPALGIPPPQLDLAGHDLVRSPNWSGRISYSHTFRLDNGGTLVPSASLRAQSHEYLREENAPVDRQAAYGVADATLTYNAPGGHWMAQAFMNNIGDQRYKDGEFPVIFLVNSFYGNPRTYGIKLDYTY